MATTIISPRSRLFTGINVFGVSAQNQAELLEVLRAINAEIVRQRLTMNVSSNFHRRIGGSTVINYNQYVDRENIHVLRSIPETAPLRKRTHDLSESHEIRWYEVATVVSPLPFVDQIEIANDGALAAIGIFAAKPGRQEDLLAALKDYGDALYDARVPGFLGLATHRGDEPTHVATYERWQGAEAYHAGGTLPPQLRALCDDIDRHLYEVLDITRFDLQREAAT